MHCDRCADNSAADDADRYSGRFAEYKRGEWGAGSQTSCAL